MSALFLKLVNMSIAASWLILAVIIVRRLLRKAPRWISCLLWALVAVRLICPISFESSLSLVPSSETIPVNIEMMQEPAIDTGIQFINEAVNPVISGSFAPDPAASANPLQIIVPTLSYLWIAGTAAMVLYALASSIKLKRSVGASIPAGDNILACDEVKSPFILGIIRPMIYVPSSMDGEILEHVITHERAHIARRDHWWKPLGFLLLAVYWFNPLCWAAYIMLCRDIETACDEKVIRDLDGSEKAAYSQTLLSCSFPRRNIAACPLAFGEVGVKERVSSVLNYKKPRFWVIAAALAACIAVALCFLTDPFSSKSLSGKLGISMDMAVKEANRSSHSEGHFAAVDYDVLRIKKGNGQTTVYAWVYYAEYSFDGNNVIMESASHIPTAVTFDTSEAGDDSSAYDVIEYWIPGDGSDYAKDIRKKFPLSLWAKALDPSGAAKQEGKCLQAAREYYGVGRTYTYNVAYANWTEDNSIYSRTLNGKMMQSDSILHLPVYKFDTKKELDSFKSMFKDTLTMDQGHDEVPSFEYITAAYDDSFFSKYSLILSYVPASSGSFRYGVSDVYCKNKAFCMYVEQLNDPEVYTADMAGWFAVVEVDKKDIADCETFDAQFGKPLE